MLRDYYLLWINYLLRPPTRWAACCRCCSASPSGIATGRRQLSVRDHDSACRSGAVCYCLERSEDHYCRIGADWWDFDLRKEKKKFLSLWVWSVIRSNLSFPKKKLQSFWNAQIESRFEHLKIESRICKSYNSSKVFSFKRPIWIRFRMRMIAGKGYLFWSDNRVLK